MAHDPRPFSLSLSLSLSLFLKIRSLTTLSYCAVVNYTVVALGLAFSAAFLLRNLYPVLSTTEAKTSKILLIIVVVLHAGFAIAIKVLFFAATSPVGPKTGDKGAGTGGDAAKGDMLRMLLR